MVTISASTREPGVMLNLCDNLNISFTLPDKQMLMLQALILPNIV